MKNKQNNHPPILHETKHWLAIHKPAGLNVEQLWDYPSVETQVKDYLKGQHRREPFLGIVHRIDRPVSGVLLLAKKKSALRHLNQQFADRQVQKVYWTICSGTPPEKQGILVHHLAKDQKNKRAVAFTTPRSGAIEARLEYRLLASNGQVSCLEIKPLSGKFHQIRVQLASIGCPILGDKKYGGQPGKLPDSIALHARKLNFTDPLNGESVTITADLPAASPLWKDWQS